MVAGEAINPRKTMPKAFRATIYRLVIFFIGSAICIGILVPYNVRLAFLGSSALC